LRKDFYTHIFGRPYIEALKKRHEKPRIEHRGDGFYLVRE